MTAQPSTRLPAPYRLTMADWLAMEEGTRIVEIIDGDVYMAPSPAIRHQRVTRNLGTRLHQFLSDTLPDAEMFFAPTGVKLSDDTVLEPDLLVVLGPNRHRIKDKYIEGAPDVVIEVLSPGSASRDLGIKRDHYLPGGVGEYWIADPETECVEILVAVDASWTRHGLFRRTDTLTSATLTSLTIPGATIWP